MKFVIGTRGSALALAQTRLVREELKKAHPDLVTVEKIIKTTGDNRLDLSLIEAPGVLLEKGLFTKELEAALLGGDIDAAVHSLKDLPTELPEGLSLGAILPREDVCDVAVLKQAPRLAELPQNAVVATSSVRRQSQVRERHPHLVLSEIRGNVPTRLTKLKEGALGAVILAAAGLNRLGYNVSAGFLEHEGERFAVEKLDWMLPAPGQGAIAVEVRSKDAKNRGYLEAVHCRNTAICVAEERAVLRGLGGGCQMALGVLSRLQDGLVELDAVFYEQGEVKRRSARGNPGEAAKDLVNQLREKS